VFQIVIPFFSLFVKDIYFLNEGCSNRSENGNINFQVREPTLFYGITTYVSPM